MAVRLRVASNLVLEGVSGGGCQRSWCRSGWVTEGPTGLRRLFPARQPYASSACLWFGLVVCVDVCVVVRVVVRVVVCVVVYAPASSSLSAPACQKTLWVRFLSLSSIGNPHSANNTKTPARTVSTNITTVHTVSQPPRHVIGCIRRFIAQKKKT